MTLRELLKEQTLSESHDIDINYWGKPEYSVISGKEILGFPSKSVHVPTSDKNNIIFNTVKIGNNLYEFYVGKYKKTDDGLVLPYKDKKYYIGTYKIGDFRDDIGIALSIISQCINNSKINDEEREYLKNFYNEKIKHPYYKGRFEEL